MTAAQLRSARERLGLTQQQLADELGVDLRTVRRWENGERDIPPLLSASAAKMILRLSATQRPSRARLVFKPRIQVRDDVDYAG